MPTCYLSLFTFISVRCQPSPLYSGGVVRSAPSWEDRRHRKSTAPTAKTSVPGARCDFGLVLDRHSTTTAGGSTSLQESAGLLRGPLPLGAPHDLFPSRKTLSKYVQLQYSDTAAVGGRNV
ncbi:Hypothetical predicted protein [Olea europaea subsp. europaea]|uniref:Uncharacterized protein n=1 Tax=Olea europaea subsp. europaea TaxID=158383 RepID=A0A8S0RLC5_OLEEU|nr:Hypothetical predicted protein [Olea europaea subsp. europaea]